MSLSLPIILEVAIGLIFIYLILSLLASELEESIAAFFQWRSKHLKKSIYRMLGGQKNSRKIEKQLKGLIEPSTRGDKSSDNDAIIADFVRIIYDNPLISSITQSTLGFSGTDDSTKYLYGPDVIPPETFANALTEVIGGDNIETLFETDKAGSITIDKDLTIPPKTQEILESLVKKSKTINPKDIDDTQRLHIAIKDWFEQAQNSTTGIYKRNSKSVLFWLGFALALLINVDTISIYQTLHNEPTVREAITQSAIGAVEKQCTSSDEDSATCIQSEISKLQEGSQLPLGWTKDKITSLKTPPTFGIKFIGFVISALAIMMGSTFWFDLLKRFVNVRNSNSLLQSHKSEQQ